jgi:uncharacterized protein (TIGR01777 family)
MNILIAGGTGFIGSSLSKHFEAAEHKVYILTRKLVPTNPSNTVTYLRDLNAAEICYDVIINLAGEPLNKKRWNDKTKKIIYDSRIQSTKNIVDYIRVAQIKPKLLITGSAIGFYGNSQTVNFDENTKPADASFIHRLCADWEAAAAPASEYGTRVCMIRTGVVLDKHHGALAEMLPAFKLGLGAVLGDGQQWFSWIHIGDVVKAIDFLITNQELSGPFNLTAPDSVTNAEFTKQLAKILHRPAFLKLPSFVVKFIFGEMAEALLLNGQKVTPHNLIAAGYNFSFPNLETALQNIIYSNP